MKRIGNRYLILLLVFMVLGIYYPSIFAPYNSVDDVKMINGLLNCDHLSLKDMFFPGNSGYYYRPLLSLTFWADKYFWGLEESFMHVENIILHLLNTLLVFLIARFICRRYEYCDDFVPFLSALLFALHPINTEAVNWISGRTDLLACMFILLSIFFLLLSLQENKLILRASASLTFLLACLCKDSAVFFSPGSLFLILFFDKNSNRDLKSRLSDIRDKLSYYGQFIAVPVIYFYIRHLAFAKGDSGIVTATKAFAGRDADLLYMIRAGFKATGFYAKKLFLPLPLNFAIVKVPDYYFILGLAVLFICCYLVYRRDLIAALLLTSVSIGSSALLVVFGRMAWTPIAERYLYIPCATFSIALVLILINLIKGQKREKALLVLALAVLSYFGYATVNRNIVWQDNLTLFEDTVRKSPDFPPAKNDLAVALLAHGRKDEAFKIFKTNKISDQLNNKEYGIDNLAMAMAAEGNLGGARSLLLKSMDESSKNYLILLNRLIEIDQKRIQKTKDLDTINEIRMELAGLLGKMHSATGDPFCYYRLGQNYLAMKKRAEAAHFFAKAYESAPEDAYYKLPAKKLAETLLR